MKKVLLGSTALVAATAVTAGMTTAAKAEMSVGGWAYQAFGLALDSDKNTSQHDGLVSYQNSEITFRGGETLDNGMVISVKAEMNAANGEGRAHGTAGKNESIDEASFTISDDWGSLELGGQDGASDSMHVGCAWISGGKGVCSGVYSQYASNATYGGSFMGTSSTMWSDPNGITYTSPSMNGLQFGVSYLPANRSSAATAPAWTYATNSDLENNWSAAVAYSGDMSDASVALSFGVDHVANPNGSAGADDDRTQFRAGADIGTGGFGLNLSYASQDYKTSSTAQVDAWTFEAVASYSTGPSTFGLSYAYGEKDTTQNTSNDETEARIIALDYSHSIGGGVYWDVHLADIDYDTAGSTTSDADAQVLQTGVGVSF